MSGSTPTEPSSGPERPSAPRSGWRGKLEQLIAEYGSIAILTYLVIFGLTWSGFAVAISMGVDVEGVAAGAGTIGAAWLATKVTQPLRIGATLALTPAVAAVWHRIRPRRSEGDGGPER